MNTEHTSKTVFMYTEKDPLFVHEFEISRLSDC